MSDRPDALELVAVARETFVRELLPALEDAHRYAGLMLANALAITLREMEHGTQGRQDELERLRAIYADQDADAATLERRLARDLRAGTFERDPRRTTVLAHLEATTRARVAISNPKALG